MNYKFMRKYFGIILPIVASVLCFTLSASSQGLPTSVEKPKFVLVLYDNNRLLPANVEADRAVNTALSASPIKRLTVNAEALDCLILATNYAKTLATFLRDKYADEPPDIIVAAGDGALGLILKTAINCSPEFLSLPHGRQHEISGGSQADPARRRRCRRGLRLCADHRSGVILAPNTAHLIVVTGASEPDKEWAGDLHEIVAAYEHRIDVEFLSGLPTADLLHRLGAVTADSVVFTPGYFQDGEGRGFLPRDAAKAIAETANAPVFLARSTPSWASASSAASCPISRRWGGRRGHRQTAAGGNPTREFKAAERRAREPERGLAAGEALGDRRETRSPTDAAVLFRTPTFWETYSHVVVLIFLAFLLQSALVTFLLFERARRRQRNNGRQAAI